MEFDTCYLNVTLNLKHIYQDQPKVCPSYAEKRWKNVEEL